MKIVVLDDMLERHMWFALAYKGHEIVHLFSLKDLDVDKHICGGLLSKHASPDIVFLDHDLDDEHWQIKETGMTTRAVLIDSLPNPDRLHEEPNGADAVKAIVTQLAGCRKKRPDLIERVMKFTVFVVHSMSSPENVDNMVKELKSFGLTAKAIRFDKLQHSKEES